MKTLKMFISFSLVFTLLATQITPANALTNPSGSTISPNQIVLPPEGGGSTCGLTKYSRYTYSTYYLDYYYYNHADSINYANKWGIVSIKVAAGYAATSIIVIGAFNTVPALGIVPSVGAGLLFTFFIMQSSIYYLNLQNNINAKNAVNGCGTITVIKYPFSGGKQLLGVYTQGQ